MTDPLIAELQRQGLIQVTESTPKQKAEIKRLMDRAGQFHVHKRPLTERLRRSLNKLIGIGN